MSDEQKPAAVTRAEFYPVISIIYMLLAFLFLGRIKQLENDTLQLIAHYLFFLASVGSSFAFSFFAIRERRRGKSGK